MRPVIAIGRAAGAAGLLHRPLAGRAMAQPRGDARRGQGLAEAPRARRHVVAPGAGWRDAPAIAADPRANVAWRRRVGAGPPLAMPCTDRPPAGTAGIAAHILSLRPR